MQFSSPVSRPYTTPTYQTHCVNIGPYPKHMSHMPPLLHSTAVHKLLGLLPLLRLLLRRTASSAVPATAAAHAAAAAAWSAPAADALPWLRLSCLLVLLLLLLCVQLLLYTMLVSTSRPDGGTHSSSACTVWEDRPVTSMSLLWILISKCSRASLLTCGERSTQ